MKVRATKLGFHAGHLRHPGTVFDIDEKFFSEEWMEKTSEDAQPEEWDLPPMPQKPMSFDEFNKQKTAPEPKKSKGKAKEPKPEAKEAPTGNQDVL